MPTPRASRGRRERSKTSTSQPRPRSRDGAVSPPSEPPTTIARGAIAPTMDADPSRVELLDHVCDRNAGVVEYGWRRGHPKLSSSVGPAGPAHRDHGGEPCGG